MSKYNSGCFCNKRIRRSWVKSAIMLVSLPVYISGCVTNLFAPNMFSSKMFFLVWANKAFVGTNINVLYFFIRFNCEKINEDFLYEVGATTDIVLFSFSLKKLNNQYLF